MSGVVREAEAERVLADWAARDRELREAAGQEGAPSPRAGVVAPNVFGWTGRLEEMRLETKRWTGEVKAMSGDELLCAADALTSELETIRLRYLDQPDAELRQTTEQVDLVLTTLRLAVVTREIAMREQVAAGMEERSPATIERNQLWHALATSVKERVNLVTLLHSLGHPLVRVGRDPRRDGSEWAGPCPLCGGRDRFRVWDGRNGLCWCRRCGWRTDAIGVVRSLVGGCAGFRDAVVYLVEQVEGRAMAEHVQTPTRRPGAGS